MPPDDRSKHSARPRNSSGQTRPTGVVWRQWIVGIFGSWTIVWLAGPIFLDSILVRVIDPHLGVATLRPGDLVRWRSEGWGNTRIGPHGSPGWQPRPALHRIVLWGDSQVEGVCVDDPEKINNQVVAIARRRWHLNFDCVSMGRSGADATQWQDLMHRADALWQPAQHVWIVTELSDLTALGSGGDVRAHRVWRQSPMWVKAAAAVRAEAVIAAGKRVLRDPDDGGLRRLRFAIGPRNREASGIEPADLAGETNQQNTVDDLNSKTAKTLLQISEQVGGRLAIVYAPAIPAFAHGLTTEHADDATYEKLRNTLIAGGVAVIDVRSEFEELWDSRRRLPRGFHNGMPGYGHLNADGNRLIAEAIVTLLRERLAR